MQRRLTVAPCVFLIALCATVLAYGGCGSGSVVNTGGVTPTTSSIPMTGPNVPGVSAAYDTVITSLMTQWNLPGVAIAVTKNGQLILARGYGFSDRENQIPVQPDMLFRVASISKTITSATVLHLVEQGKLNLSDKFLNILGSDFAPPSTADPRLRTITVQNLLQHSGGWDSTSTGYDPMFDSVNIAAAQSVAAPAGCPDIIRFMLKRSLDFDPGSKSVYSNFGYCILGRVIEKAIGTGESYESYVQNNVLAPMGIHAMHIGHSLLSGRLNNEVKYYDFPGASNASSVFPGGGSVPWPYGGFDLEAMDSHGGWVASAIDLTRFMTALDGHRGPSFLSSTSISAMIAQPNIPPWIGAAAWYGLGLNVRPQVTDANWWHDGSLPGTATLLVRSYHGYTWAILVNSRPQASDAFETAMDNGMWTALGSGLTGSPTDLYSQFPSQ